MSEFEQFFERGKPQTLVSKFNHRATITLENTPTYLRIAETGRHSAEGQAIARSSEFLSLENRVHDGKIIKVSSRGEDKYYAPPFAYDNFRTLDSTIMNYRRGNEPELQHLLDLIVPDDGVYVDVGANWGYFAFHLCARDGFKGEVYAYEPLPVNFEVMSAIAEHFGWDDRRLKLLKTALSDKDGEAAFYVHDLQSSSMEKPSDNVLRVEARRLDSYTFERMDLLKVDVEGAELSTLHGAEKTIEKHKPCIFLESHYQPDTAETVQHSLEPFYFLEKLGYRFFMPSWLQVQRRAFFVGIGWDFEMDEFALTPFNPIERKIFPIDILNIFACHESQLGKLGMAWDKRFP